jgi:hypothetical protein
LRRIAVDDPVYAAFARLVQRPQFSQKVELLRPIPTSRRQFYDTSAPDDARFFTQTFADWSDG